MFAGENGIPVHRSGWDRLRFPHDWHVVHGDRGEPLMLLWRATVEVSAGLEVLGEGHAWAVLTKMAAGAGTGKVGMAGHVHEGV